MSVKIPKLYGVPLSQPFRSVAWTMLQLQMPFQIQMAVPGMSSKIGTQHENYRSLTPYRSSTIPLLMMFDDDHHDKGSSSTTATTTTALTESPAIMMHLCEKIRNASSSTASPPPLYASPGSIEKAKIDSYLHWHHGNTRFLAKLFQIKVRPDLKKELSERDEERIQELLTSLNSGWLQNNKMDSNGGGPFLGGLHTPTIADILAYGELSTVTMTKLLNIDPNEHANIYEWMQRLSELPYHDEVHAALVELGDMSDKTTDEEQESADDAASARPTLPKRLGAATKVGLNALNDAQASYAPGST